MKGTRPLDNDEIRRVSAAFNGTFAVRNRGLFMLGVSTGGRITKPQRRLSKSDKFREGFTMIDKIRNDFASYGLEILKRAVLLVLHEAKHKGELLQPNKIRRGSVPSR